MSDNVTDARGDEAAATPADVPVVSLPVRCGEFHVVRPVRRPDGGPRPTDPAYLLRYPSPLTKPKWNEAVAAAGAHPVADAKLRAAVRDAAEALLEEPTRAEVLDALDTLERLTGPDAARDPEDVAELEAAGLVVAAFEDEAAAEWAPYAKLIARKSYWWTMARTLAAQFFLHGVTTCEDVETGGGAVRVFARTRTGDRITEAELASIPPDHLPDIGMAAMVAMTTNAAQKKS